MKKTFFKLRTASATLALSGLMLNLSVPSFANNKRIEILSSSSIQPSVKYLNSDEKSSSFLVQLDAAAPVTFELAIKEKTGLVIFSQVFEAASFSKTFKVLNEEQGNIHLAFVIKTLPDGKLNTFNVTTQEKTVTDITVTKAK